MNADALFGPVPEPTDTPAAESKASSLTSGTDLDMETQVAEILLKKTTEELLAEASEGLPDLSEDWSPKTLPRDEPTNAYVEDDDEAEYYDELDELNTVLKASNEKEREALEKLFEKNGGSGNTGAKQAPTQAKASKGKPLAIRPNAAVITKKKPGAAPSAARPKSTATARKPSRPVASAKAAPKNEPTPEEKTPPAAEEVAEAAPADGPTVDPNASAKELISQGRKFLLSGNPTTAEKAYRLALTKSPSSTRARYGLAKALYQKNRAAEATTELRKILGANKNHGAALLMMGSLLQEQGQSSQARTYYQRYLDARPNGRRADEVRSILGRL